MISNTCLERQITVNEISMIINKQKTKGKIQKIEYSYEITEHCWKSNECLSTEIINK